MSKNLISEDYSDEVLTSDKNIRSWNEFMESEIKNSQDNIVVDREEDF